MRYTISLALFFGMLTSTGCTREPQQETPHVNIGPSRATKIKLFAGAGSS
jgi:hypothetical protein